MFKSNSDGNPQPTTIASPPCTEVSFSIYFNPGNLTEIQTFVEFYDG